MTKKQQKQTTQKKSPRKTKTNKQSQPHDSFFKKVFKRPDYCDALMKVVLDPRLYALFNWQALKIQESVSTGSRGEERRADIVMEVPTNAMEAPTKNLNKKFSVIFTILLEHKSYQDTNAVLQMLGYYNDIAQRSGGIILPVIITCGKEKQATIPADYLSWALQKQNAPEELKKHFRQLPNFGCLVVNLHALSYQRMRRGGEAACLALFGMRNYWEMGEEVVYEIIKKAHLLPEEEQGFVLSMLIDYYESADKGYGLEGFDSVERKHLPDLKEEERIVPDMEFGFDRARKEGMQQGLRKGKRLGKLEGIEQGIEKGIEQGIEKGKLEMVKRMLARGISDDQICDLSQLTKAELAAIKKETS